MLTKRVVTHLSANRNLESQFPELFLSVRSAATNFRCRFFERGHDPWFQSYAAQIFTHELLRNRNKVKAWKEHQSNETR